MNDTYGCITPDYDAVVNRFVQVCGRLRLATRILCEADGYPLWVAETWPREQGLSATESNNRQALWLSAGIHGDEPASVLGLLSWLEKDAAAVLPALHITVILCLNPYGYVHHVRTAADGRDLNRLFRTDDAPTVAAVKHLLRGKRYSLAVDMHEDWESELFYLYEIKDTPPFLGERIVGTMANYAGISHQEPIDDVIGSVTEHGIIQVNSGRPEESLPALPLGRYLFSRHTAHVLAPETPGRLQLARRIAMQAEVIRISARFVSTAPATEIVSRPVSLGYRATMSKPF